LTISKHEFGAERDKGTGERTAHPGQPPGRDRRSHVRDNTHYGVRIASSGAEGVLLAAMSAPSRPARPTAPGGRSLEQRSAVEVVDGLADNAGAASISDDVAIRAESFTRLRCADRPFASPSPPL
jgi:hypothetical protein